MSSQDVLPGDGPVITPSSTYSISGATLLAALRVLEDGLPCKYIALFDRVTTLLVNVKELGENRLEAQQASVLKTGDSNEQQ